MAKTTPPANDDLETPIDFATTLARLEALVEKLESGEMGLEDSLKAFEQGVKLTREARKRLEAADLKVQQLQVRDDNDSASTASEPPV